jgi:hypothetical protein
MESTRSLSKDGESEHHIEMSWLGTHRARIETYLCGIVAHVLRWHFRGEEDLFTWNARGTDGIGARLLIAVGAS